MQIIWYNADLKQYRFGNENTYTSEVSHAEDPNAYTVLMELDSEAKSLAGKIIRQLNIATDLPFIYAS